MNAVQKEVLENITVDWGKIKEILCGIAKAVEDVCQQIPDGLVKKIICGVGGVLEIVCQSLPDSQL